MGAPGAFGAPVRRLAADAHIVRDDGSTGDAAAILQLARASHAKMRQNLLWATDYNA